MPQPPPGLDPPAGYSDCEVRRHAVAADHAACFDGIARDGTVGQIQGDQILNLRNGVNDFNAQPGHPDPVWRAA